LIAGRNHAINGKVVIKSPFSAINVVIALLSASHSCVNYVCMSATSDDIASVLSTIVVIITRESIVDTRVLLSDRIDNAISSLASIGRNAILLTSLIKRVATFCVFQSGLTSVSIKVAVWLSTLSQVLALCPLHAIDNIMANWGIAFRIGCIRSVHTSNASLAGIDSAIVVVVTNLCRVFADRIVIDINKALDIFTHASHSAEVRAISASETIWNTLTDSQFIIANRFQAGVKFSVSCPLSAIQVLFTEGRVMRAVSVDRKNVRAFSCAQIARINCAFFVVITFAHITWNTADLSSLSILYTLNSLAEIGSRASLGALFWCDASYV